MVGSVEAALLSTMGASPGAGTLLLQPVSSIPNVDAKSAEVQIMRFFIRTPQGCSDAAKCRDVTATVIFVDTVHGKGCEIRRK
jgi:hypothetical protein